VSSAARVSRPGAPLAALALAAGLAIFAAACGVGTPAGTLTPGAAPTGTLAPSPTAAATLPSGSPSAIATSPAATPTVAALTATPTLGRVVGYVVVAHTDGQGAYVHESKQVGDRLRAYPEGTVLEVLGPAEAGEGGQWLPVRTPDGARGWVLQEFTEPTSAPPPTSAPAETTPAAATPPAVGASPTP